MRSRRHNFGGFTLLELVLVLIVITVIVAIVAPRLLGFTKGRQTAEVAESIESLTRYARTQAIADATVYRLNITGRTYSVTQEDPAIPDKSTALKAQATMELDHPLPDNVQVSFTPAGAKQATDAVHFYADGRVEAGDIVVTDREQTFTIRSLTATDSYQIVPAGQ